MCGTKRRKRCSVTMKTMKHGPEGCHREASLPPPGLGDELTEELSHRRVSRQVEQDSVTGPVDVEPNADSSYLPYHPAPPRVSYARADQYGQRTQPSPFYTLREPRYGYTDGTGRGYFPHRSPYEELPTIRERTYRGPKPSIPDLMSPDPREFSKMKIALENIPPVDATERFKFQILTDHLKHEEASLVANSYCNSRQPYTDTMLALTKKYGQPHKLAVQHITELMDGPDVCSGDLKAFRLFALRVRSLVDFADWLEYELEVQEDSGKSASYSKVESSIRKKENRRDSKHVSKTTTVLLGTEKAAETHALTSPLAPEPPANSRGVMDRRNAYCPYCDNTNHYLNSCANFKQLNREQKESLIRSNNRCWRCGRGHRAAKCTLKAPCKMCNRKHLLVLHEVNRQRRHEVNRQRRPR
ncbi:hypothetical protein AAFF_G00196060 [Aldrovandia affinis]|uniref:Uncharacterized protein n=1 Tax=Aldrovandia affinis TaxID=143900 RepID=A0AAD7RIX1_9TELE|nr:hypothetical protein AAFF_G00196060 [Aldrovandia affinis]